jgi:lipoprotein-anchoring transpeptidase ErfK/SrfK
MISLHVSIANQELKVIDDSRLIKSYRISTAKNGAGELANSEKTPRGIHKIRAKIGKDCAINTIFVGRRPTGEIYTPELKKNHPNRDWILTRILWLSGLEIGKNRLGIADTMRRYIYIHGTPEDVDMGVPGSKGCIRMRNKDLIELFDMIACYTIVQIEE